MATRNGSRSGSLPPYGRVSTTRAIQSDGHTRKSAISIPSNVAEGANRRALPAYVNHVNIAMGSEGELFTQLELGRRLGYISANDLAKPFSDLAEIGRMLNGLSTSLELAIERQKAQQQR